MLTDKKILLPPWLAYPEIERYSIGWRMGYGESYMMKWLEWYETLLSDEVASYQDLFPEPPTWKGFWNHDDECIYYTRDEFRIEFWRKDGVPKYSLEQVRKEQHTEKMPQYCMFWKAQRDSIGKGCFSQWQMTPFFSVIHHFNCMEQYMMYQKAKLFGDAEIMQQILSCNDPRKIKALGQKVKNFDEAVWSKVKYSIVLNGNYKKFSQNQALKNFLLQTGDQILVEASPYDAVWGIKMDESDQNAQDPLKWRGQNLLGFALMEVRDVLRKVCKNEALAVPVESR